MHACIHKWKMYVHSMYTVEPLNNALLYMYIKGGGLTLQCWRKHSHRVGTVCSRHSCPRSIPVTDWWGGASRSFQIQLHLLLHSGWGGVGWSGVGWGRVGEEVVIG